MPAERADPCPEAAKDAGCKGGADGQQSQGSASYHCLPDIITPAENLQPALFVLYSKLTRTMPQVEQIKAKHIQVEVVDW